MDIKYKTDPNGYVGTIFLENTPVTEELRNVTKLKNGNVRLEAVLQEANQPNRNKRIYKKETLQEALQMPYIQEKLKTNSLLGEMNHPISNDPARQLRVEVDRASHVIKEFYWEGDNLIGKVETAATTVGKDFAGLIKENGMIASFSMRGAGDVSKGANGMMTVKSPIKIITYDAVHFPSHPGAYQRKLLEHDQSLSVKAYDIGEYIKANSKNFQQLNEEFLWLNESDVEIKYEEGLVVIEDKRQKKIKANMLLEQKLMLELDDYLTQF